MLDVIGLTSGYDSLTVLRDVSLRVDEGEIVAVIGANGAGKTTLLRAITGITRWTGGDVQFNGRSLRGRRPSAGARMGLAHIPEGRRLFPSMSVYENLALGMYTVGARTRSAVAGDRLEFVYELFPILAEKQSQRAGSLSGGQQQMLALARGLMANPRLILIDEMSMGLAPMPLRAIMDAIGSLTANGVAILLVEQMATLALEVSHRAYILRGGSVVGTALSKQLRDDRALLNSMYFGSAASPAAST